MRKKAVFFDIDWTLWDDKSVIPESTVEAIEHLKAAGHAVFINSGRCRSFIRRENLLNIGFDGIVSGCGTMVEYEGKILLYHRIDNDLVTHTLNIVRRYGLKPILEGRLNLYMDDDEFTEKRYADRLRSELGSDLIGISENQGRWEVSKLSCDTRGCDTKSCFAELSEYYHYMIHNSAVAEFVPLGYDKGTGLTFVCNMLGIDTEDSIAFGDSANDTEMLKAAGCGVVMGNGSDEVKTLADYVTSDIHDDGIYNACVKLGLI